ncbi:alpha/beta hydrolase [Citricoccus sp. GCM10030269]|uniref:alpha/beta hydrolase n=1 Tax=Citricoccus sp. GCM10030269 TaxID=3273388 RepID=UPI00361176ED
MKINPEILQALEAIPDSEPPPPGDALALREMFIGIYTGVAQADAPAPHVERTEVSAVSADGTAVPARLYQHRDSRPGSAIVYLHGGGMMGASVDLYDSFVAAYVERTGVPFLSVDYRRTPEAAWSTPMEDSWAGLAWLLDHAAELSVDPGRVAVMGDSAGGTLAAGVAVLARDRGVDLARQILVYPMLDDRNTEPDPALAPTALWTYENNTTAWDALLGDARGGPEVPATIAPARLQDATGLAPAYIEVGGADILRDESLAYAALLARHDVDVEFHLHPGAVHASDRMAPEADVTRRQFADRDRVIGEL